MYVVSIMHMITYSYICAMCCVKLCTTYIQLVLGIYVCITINSLLLVCIHVRTSLKIDNACMYVFMYL